jgi:hypothetical protein
MTPEEAQVLVDRIKECSGDPEASHGYEDDLYHRVVSALADISIVDFTYFDLLSLIEVAQIALTTEILLSERRYA